MSRKQPDNIEDGYNCLWQAMVPSYIQGELSEKELVQFEDHLGGCSACQVYVAEVRHLIRQFQKTLPGPLTRDLVPGILERIPQDAWTQDTSPVLPRRPRLFHFTKAAACLLLALASAWLIFYFSGRHERSLLPDTERQAHKKETVSRESQVVAQALDWLAKVQEPTGAWDGEKWGGQRNYTVGLTALALLSFLGSEQVPAHGPYSDTIDRAVNCLLQQQNTEGYFGPPHSGAMYNHGIATVALLEVYRLTKDTKLKIPLDRAVKYIRTTQTADGGWGYFGGFIDSANTSISIWQLHALILANRVGWESTKKNIEKGLAWLKTMINREGRVGYSGPGDFPYGSETLTAMGAFCLFASGYEGKNSVEKNTRIKRSLKDIASKQGRDIDYYQLYFLTYALHAVEEGQPDRHMPNVQKALVERQIKSGPHSGSWEPSDRWSSAGGRIYATTMATLSLEADQRAAKIIGWMRGTY